jgi:hypothetical protein
MFQCEFNSKTGENKYFGGEEAEKTFAWANDIYSDTRKEILDQR